LRQTGGKLWIWTLIPLLILVGAELLAHRLVHKSVLNRTWYRGALDTAASQNLDFIFVGTSRTMSGIDIGVWEQETERALGEDLVCFNLGRAYAGPVAHHFGLRELVEQYPERMRGCTVLIEFSAGLPEYTWDWDHQWFFAGNTQLIVDYMKFSDFRRFLALPNSFDCEVALATRYFGRPFNLMAGRRVIQQAVDYRGQRALRGLLSNLGAGYRITDSQSGSLENPRLRTDPQGVEQLRKIIRSRVDPTELARQESLTPWEDRIVCQTAEYLLEHGVRVAFYEVVVPSYVWSVHGTEVRRKDRLAFSKWAEAHEIPIIESRFAITDGDFPDLSHLRADKVPDYTRSMVGAFLRTVGENP